MKNPARVKFLAFSMSGLELVGKCRDGEDVTGSVGTKVLRPGLTVARKEAVAGICGFSCGVNFVFPVPQASGQADVVGVQWGQPMVHGMIVTNQSAKSVILKCGTQQLGSK